MSITDERATWADRKDSTIVQITDPDYRTVAIAQVSLAEGRFAGTVDLGPMPASVREVFEEFEEIVNDQVFSLLDTIEDRIASLSLKAIGAAGQAADLEDLQIYPSSGRISFRLVRQTVNGPPAEPDHSQSGIVS